MSVYPPPGDDRVIEFEPPQEEVAQPTPYWDPLNLILGLCGAMLICGVFTIDSLTNFETITAGGFFLYVSGRQLIGFYVPLAPSLIPLMVVTRVLLSIATVVTPILLITS